jgi:hypothetical protein
VTSFHAASIWLDLQLFFGLEARILLRFLHFGLKFRILLAFGLCVGARSLLFAALGKYLLDYTVL